MQLQTLLLSLGCKNIKTDRKNIQLVNFQEDIERIYNYLNGIKKNIFFFLAFWCPWYGLCSSLNRRGMLPTVCSSHNNNNFGLHGSRRSGKFICTKRMNYVMYLAMLEQDLQPPTIKIFGEDRYNVIFQQDNASQRACLFFDRWINRLNCDVLLLQQTVATVASLMAP